MAAKRRSDIEDEILKMVHLLPPDQQQEVYVFTRDKLKETAGEKPRRLTLSEKLEELSNIPTPEERARLPRDGAKNYKHYLYGHPKVEDE